MLFPPPSAPINSYIIAFTKVYFARLLKVNVLNYKNSKE